MPPKNRFAVRCFRISSALLTNNTLKKAGDIREDYQEIVNEYLQARDEQSKNVGILTKLAPLDLSINGIKPGELMTACAFAGGYKSTLMVNIAHFNVTLGRNVIFFTLEMPYGQVRRHIYTLHSTADVFSSRGFNPLYQDQVKNGCLSDEDEEFLPDFL